MKSYTISSHTADVRLKIRGKTLEEIFLNALQGMNRILIKNYEKYLNEHAIVKEMTISSFDTTTLLIDFLSEILTLSHINKAIFHTVSFLEIGPNTLHVRLIGGKVKSFKKDIKAISYHEAEIRRNKKGEYETTLVLDI